MNELSSRMTEAKNMQSIPTSRGGGVGIGGTRRTPPTSLCSATSPCRGGKGDRMIEGGEVVV